MATVAPYVAGALIIVGGVICIVVTDGACAAIAAADLTTAEGLMATAGACAVSVCGSVATAGAVGLACQAPVCGDEPGGGPKVGCGESFTADTDVVTASGAKVPISKLKPGEKIKAANTATGKTETEQVQAVLLNHDTDLYDLTVATSNGRAVIHVTFNHPIWDDSTHGWVKAGELHAGDRLHTDTGLPAVVVGGSSPKDTVGWMWDLTISNDHDFYVVTSSGTAVLVHNSGDGHCPVFFADLGNGDTVSPAGLVYGPGKIDHVLAHTAENPDRATHTVFEEKNPNKVLDLVDEGWGAVKLGNAYTYPDDSFKFVAPMGRPIGTNGEQFLQMAVDPSTNRILTAYPVASP